MRLVFDIGGTNTRLALAEGARLSQERVIPTPATPAEFFVAVAEYLAGKEVAEAAGGVAGAVAGHTFLGGAHLSEAWEGADFSAGFAALGVGRLALVNDAEAAAFGEAVAGAGKGYRLVAYLTLSTGVGGALVEEGRLAPHAGGFEPGHQIIEEGSGMTLEEAVGGAAIAKEYGKPGEELPQEVFDARVPSLAAGLYNLIELWSPEVIVLGGALARAGRYPLPALRAALEKLPPPPRMPALAEGALGDAAGLLGSALLPIEKAAPIA
jgi:glucokinase